MVVLPLVSATWWLPLVGGLLLLGGMLGLLPFSEMNLHVGGADIHLPVYIPAIDWGVVAIILGF